MSQIYFTSGLLSDSTVLEFSYDSKTYKKSDIESYNVQDKTILLKDGTVIPIDTEVSCKIGTTTKGHR